MSKNKNVNIMSLNLDAIKFKLMHRESGEGWSMARANAVEIEYRRFLHLMKKFPTEETCPSVDVDSFWHYHILDTRKYAIDCEKVFGYFLHHYPYVGMTGADDGARERAGKRMRELSELTFGESEAHNPALGAAVMGNVAYCGATGNAAYCGATGNIAYCGAAGKVAYCGAAGKAAYCGAAAKVDSCGAAGKVAYCGATAKVDSCGATDQVAYCGASAKVDSCGETDKAAYCGAADKVAYCGAATKVAYCGAAHRMATREAIPQTAYCGITGAGGRPASSLPDRQAAQAA